MLEIQPGQIIHVASQIYLDTQNDNHSISIKQTKGFWIAVFRALYNTLSSAVVKSALEQGH